MLATLVIPNVRGFVSSGKQKAYDAEQGSLQLSMDGWRNTIGQTQGPSFIILQCELVSGLGDPGTGAKCVDTGQGSDPETRLDFSTDCIGALDSSGNPITIAGVTSGSETVFVACNPYLDIGALANEGFLSNAAAARSADTSKNTTALNATSGHYGWFAGTGGLMQSTPTFIKNVFP